MLLTRVSAGSERAPASGEEGVQGGPQRGGGTAVMGCFKLFLFILFVVYVVIWPSPVSCNSIDTPARAMVALYQRSLKESYSNIVHCNWVGLLCLEVYSRISRGFCDFSN